jgi:general stress protein 26
MSNRELNQEISEYAQSVALGVLVYIRADLTPVQRTFGAFAVSGTDILLATGKSSAKLAEIITRPKVSFLLENRDQKIKEWKSALYIGTAAPIERTRNSSWQRRLSASAMSSLKMRSKRAGYRILRCSAFRPAKLNGWITPKD